MQLWPVLALSALTLAHSVGEHALPKLEGCLSAREMRQAIAEHRAVQPIIALRAAGAGEKIRAQLCKSNRGLVYLITALGRDGHVSRVVIDAASGHRIGLR